MRRGLRPVLGRRIRRVRWPRGRCRPLKVTPNRRAVAQAMQGKRIEQVLRRGKHLVLVLEDHSALVFHPRMTGLVLLEEPPDREHLRMELLLMGSGVDCVRFWDRRGLGTIAWWGAGQWERALGPPRLGPDALAVSLAQLRRHLGSSSAAIKVALMDQRRVAGIGNLYASEILFQARVHPATACAQLTGEQWRRIHRAMREVLQAAIRYEGSTLNDGTYRNALNRQGSYQNHHRVYAKAGRPCPRCGHGIQRIVQAQRSTFFCPRCQPPP